MSKKARTETQVIYREGEPAFAVIPWAEYLRLEGELSDEALYRMAVEADEERFPEGVVERLLAGESPVKVYREHRGLTQKALAERAQLSTLYISQIECRGRTGSPAVLARIGRALGVTVDDLLDHAR